VPGGEAQLQSAAHFRALDPVPARVLNQVLLGVSTRGYLQSLEPVPAAITARGASESAASRHLIARMSEKLGEQLTRRLEQFDVLVLMIDVSRSRVAPVVVALGILCDRAQRGLGLWQGSTENAALCTSLLNDLLERGLKVDDRILCVIDRGPRNQKGVVRCVR
jgi:transposase-like protein